MRNFVVHRCRLFEYIPCAIHNIAVTSSTSDIAVSRSNGNIEIWSTSNCFPKMIIPGSTGSVEALLWVGNRLISGGINGDIIEYDLFSGTTRLTVDSFGGAVWCMCSSPRKDFLAAGCEDGSVKLFNLGNKSIKYARAFDKQECRILSIAWHVDGNVVVTGSADIIRLWNASTGHAIQKICVERVMKKLETIVWCIAILKDFTVISGDSYGRVEFWNGINGTLLKSLKSHRADVLCLCFGDDEDHFFASGIDPKVIEFNKVTPGDPTSWVAGKTVKKHTHDVRAVAVSNNRLFSGGVDTQLVVKSLSSKDDSCMNIYGFPSKSLVSMSRKSRLLLFQYEKHLEIWKIAEVTPPECLDSRKSLPIEKPPVKLMKVNMPSSDPNIIKSCSLSPCGKWLVYSTVATTRLYYLFSEDDCIPLKIKRVHVVGLHAAHDFAFTPDSNHVILSTTNHKLLIFKLCSETIEAQLVQEFILKNTHGITHLLAVSTDSTLLACANLNGDINVYDIVNMTIDNTTFPRYQETPTAISFLPRTKTLTIAYADMQILEFDLTKKTYSQWTKHYLSRNSEPFLLSCRQLKSDKQALSVITAIHHLENEIGTITYFVSRQGIYVLEKGVKSSKDTSLRFCKEFSSVLHADFLDDETLLVVERPHQAIFDQLPPTLHRKKFGV